MKKELSQKLTFLFNTHLDYAAFHSVLVSIHVKLTLGQAIVMRLAIYNYIVTCQAHPVLVKMRIKCAIRSLFKFFFR